MKDLPTPNPFPLTTMNTNPASVADGCKWSYGRVEGGSGWVAIVTANPKIMTNEPRNQPAMMHQAPQAKHQQNVELFESFLEPKLANIKFFVQRRSKRHQGPLQSA